MTAIVDADPLTYATARWSALGSYVQLVVHPSPLGPAAVERASHLLAEVERSCSRFRPDSDLSRVNSGAATWVPVGDLLVRALVVALDAARQTGGLVDPTLGLVLRELGYDRDLADLPGVTDPAGPSQPARPARAPSSSSAATALPAPRTVGTWRDVALDPVHGVWIPFGRALDLGATGKAFAADLIAATLPAELGVDVLVSLGGDVAVGHAHPDADRRHAWQVVVCEWPGQAAAGAETVRLPGGGVATSSVVRRRWQRDGRELHHLVDPRTGAPARPVWRTASVVATDCATANAASTAAVLLGDDAVDWLTGRGLGARLVGTDGSVLHTPGWPAAGG